MSGYSSTGISNPKFVRRRRSDGFFWSTAGAAFETYTVGNIANYGITATEAGATGSYTATDPADTTEGDYLFIAAAGASLAVTDIATNIRWQDHAGPYANELSTARAEPGQGAPPASASPLVKQDWLYAAWRNKKTQTATTFNLFADDTTTVIAKAATSDDGTTGTVGEIASGP